jgi:hypothetical protein
MFPMRRMLAAPGAAIGLLLALQTGPVAAGGAPDIEAGIFTHYVAPEAGTLTPGSITFGYLGTAEVIAPDAELVPPADTNLAFLVGAAPTCLEVTRAGGEITRLAFVASCSVSGPVTFVADLFGPGVDGYVTSDRIATPESVVLGDPGINALMKTTADSGGVLSVTFQVDVSFGAPIAFSATTTLAGAVSVLGTGDIQVGAAILLDAVIDAGSRALLEQADADGLTASVVVQGAGLIDVSGKSQPAVTITLSVLLADPPPSATPSAGMLPDTSLAATGRSSAAWIVALAAMVGATAVIGARRRVSARRGVPAGRGVPARRG